MSGKGLTGRVLIGGSMAAALFLGAQNARAAAPDPFFGNDKVLHFAVAGGIAGVGYGITTAITPDRWKAFAVGGGAAVGAGALKEAIDATGSGDPSWKDFAWDVIGAACGLGVAWVIDVAAHNGSVPPLTASEATVRPRAAMFRLVF